MGDDLGLKAGVPFPKQMRLKDGEPVMFSWIVFASKAQRDRVNAKVMKDERLAGMDAKKMPFDCGRMVYGGFKVLVDIRAGRGGRSLRVGSFGDFIERFRAAVPARWKFAWRYRIGDTPWDTGITPPEVMEFLARAAPGRALDLGCGTGTNALTLARRGWRVTGVDFAPRAIREARRRAARERLGIEFLAADVSDLGALPGGYDYALDIGCLHSLPGKRRAGYAAGLGRLVRPGGIYMLYAWLPRERAGGSAGLAPEEIESLLRPDFAMERKEIGEEKGSPSAWYRFHRRGGID